MYSPVALVLTASSKRSAPSTPGSSEKMMRKVLTLPEKMDVINMFDSGKGWTATSRKFGLHKATLSTIYTIREKIRQSVREKKIFKPLKNEGLRR